jgi:predicted amidohydrolase
LPCSDFPKGDVLGVQCAASANLSSRDTFKTQSKVEVFQTELGNLALCVDVDINSPEFCRLANLPVRRC